MACELLQILPAEEAGRRDQRRSRCLRQLREAIDSTQYTRERFRNVLGRHPGTLRPVDLRDVMRSVVTRLPKSASCRVVLNPLPARTQVVGDREWLWHSLDNLLRNAQEATQGQRRGRVAITATTRKWPAALVVRIRDNGHGIPAEAMPRTFDLNNSTKPRGLGLGLHLVQRAAQLHRGRVQCQSRPGKGTTFTVELPLSPMA